MSYFENPQSRKGTHCTKWDRYESRYQLSDVIPLWVADMDFECPKEVGEAIIKRAKHPIFGYTDPSDSCLDAIINWEKRHHDLDIKKEDIVLTTGVVYAIYTAVDILVKTDEKVLVMTPVYPPFFNVPNSLNRNVVYCPLEKDGSINYKGLEELLANDNKIKMCIFCNPHNPIGKSWTHEELYTFLKITSKYGIYVVSDEIHADLTFKPHQHVSMLKVDDSFNDHILLLGAPTKTFNLAGMKVSYALIPNHDLCLTFAKAAKASGLSSINIFGFEVLEAAYDHGDQWLEDCLDYIYQNMIWLKEFLEKELPLCKFEIPDATYLAWVDFSGYDVPENFQEILKFEGKVELNDGKGFKGGLGYQRINCACPKETLEEGMKRIVSCMKQHGWIE
ncbi:MAG: MalY/PatB family protein [Traorella sp.]